MTSLKLLVVLILIILYGDKGYEDSDEDNVINLAVVGINPFGFVESGRDVMLTQYRLENEGKLEKYTLAATTKGAPLDAIGKWSFTVNYSFAWHDKKLLSFMN